MYFLHINTFSYQFFFKNLRNFLVFTFFFLFSALFFNLWAQDDLRVLNNWLHYSDASNSLYHHLTDKAYRYLDQRENDVSRISTISEVEKRQAELKQAMWDVLGPFPEKTDLNPKVTGKVKKDGYSIENVIYESLPGFYVTASLFIPDKLQEPAPAILFCSGHSFEAYRKQSYQLPLLNLVKKGFIVLAIDPIGQGERMEYFDPKTNASVIGGSTKEHSYPSPQASLIGQSVARYFIWDGIRSIDYLVSRKEVDAKRIGVHGLSGGGTQTAYISALDDRVAASAPAGYITSYRRLMESIGVQDGEQNLFHGILEGIDHADYIVMRAPKPTLVMATTRDFFSIQGTRETYSECKRIYNILGEPANLELTEDDDGHTYTKKNREAMYAFFQKHLNFPGSAKEEDVEYLTGEELQKTTTGQLASSIKHKTVFDLNRVESEKWIKRLEKLRKKENYNKTLPEIVESVKKLSGYSEPSLNDQPLFTGRTSKEGYVIEKYFIKGGGNYVIPYLLIIPDKVTNKAAICLFPQGKSEATEKKEIEMFIEKGYTILIPDLIGTGELANDDYKGDAYIENTSYNIYFTAMLTGNSIVGIRASDVVKLSRILSQKEGIDEVVGVSWQTMSSVLLHAAAFDTVISRIVLIKPYSSYRSFVENRFYDPELVYSLVPGALTRYDLPDLVASLAPRCLIVTEAAGANSETILKPDEKTQAEVEAINGAYKRLDANEKLKIHSSNSIDIFNSCN
jgi:cephalosporin-C deacetylase-like acetyl esterase